MVGDAESLKRGYMVVTIHYIDAEWNMKSAIIGFVRVMYPHTGERLAEHLIEVVKDMGGFLLQSLWAVTGDNASTNPAMLQHINEHLQNAIDAYPVESVELAPVPAISTRRTFLLGCFAYALQLAVKGGLKRCQVFNVAIGLFVIL